MHPDADGCARLPGDEEVTRGRFWHLVSVVVAIAGGLIGECVARAAGVLPSGWGWSIAAYLAAAAVTFTPFTVVLTKSGR